MQNILLNASAKLLNVATFDNIIIKEFLKIMNKYFIENAHDTAEYNGVQEGNSEIEVISIDLIKGLLCCENLILKTGPYFNLERCFTHSEFCYKLYNENKNEYKLIPGHYSNKQ